MKKIRLQKKATFRVKNQMEHTFMTGKKDKRRRKMLKLLKILHKWQPK
jgi:hypothetical protein